MECRSSGKGSLTVTVPDTVSSWQTTAFALHPADGLGVLPQPINVLLSFLFFFLNDSSLLSLYNFFNNDLILISLLCINLLAFQFVKVTVFKRFFAEMKLPFSVVRGEFFELLVSVFYFARAGDPVSASVSAIVSLEPSARKEFKSRTATLQTNGTGNALPDLLYLRGLPQFDFARVEQTVLLENGQPATVLFHIVPTRLGTIRILVNAKTLIAGSETTDQVEQTVLVEVHLLSASLVLWRFHPLCISVIY